MKEKRLLNLIGEINEDYIMEAAPSEKSRRNPVWIPWMGAAACFALILGIGILAVRRSAAEPDKIISDSIIMIEYQNAYYEIIENNPDFLERKGIPTEITEELAGKHISYLKKEHEAERSDYIVSAEETDFELLEYAPANQEAVKIFRDRDAYFAVIFCNYLIADSESLPMEEMFRVYGITNPKDIKSIASVKTDNEYQADGAVVTDPVLIASFYDEIVTLDAYSEDDFDKTQFADIDESEAAERHTQFADDRNDFMIETADGLRFIVSYYPASDWVYGSLTQTYYRLSPALENWMEINLK